MGAICQCSFNFFGPGAAGGPQTNLEYFIDMVHFRRSTNRARISLANAVDMITPIQMSINVDKGNWSLLVVSPQDGYRYAVISPQYDRQYIGSQKFADNFLRFFIVASHVTRIARDIANVDDSNILAVEYWTADVKIPVAQTAQGALAETTNRRWCIGLIVGDFIHRVGIAKGNSEDSHIGRNVIEIGDNRKIVKALVFFSGWDRK